MALAEDLAGARRAQSRARLQLRSNLVRTVLAIWRGLGAWNREDIPRFAAPAARLVRAGQLQEARLTLGYLDRVSRLRTGRPSPTVRLDRVPGRANRPDLRDVYTRPFVWTWTEMDDGRPLADAVDMAAYRIQRSVETDLELVARNTAAAVVEADPRILGYRRVLSDKPNHCDLCVIAATNTYKRGDLMPIHPACGCMVEPIYDVGDNDSELDARIEAAYRRAAERTQIAVLEHGEYGPYLQAA